MYINLIKPEEIRSSSAIRKVFLIQLAIGISIAVLLLLIASFIFGSVSAAQRRKAAESDKKLLTPQYNAVMAMKREIKEIELLANVVEETYKSRLDWYQLLRTIQLNVSPNIQLIRFNISETLGQIDGMATRNYSIYLHGKVTGEHSELDVQKIIGMFKKSPFFTNIVESADVRRYTASDLPNEKDFRIFDIECILKPIKLSK